MGNEARDRPRLTPKGERARSGIVRAAAQLIHERGVVGTTLDDIRSAAGVSGSQLSHYFAGKDELVQAVIDYQAETITANQRQADLGSPEGLRAWRDIVLAQAKSGAGQGWLPAWLARRAARRNRRAGLLSDRGGIPAVVGGHQRRAARAARGWAPPARRRPGRPGRHPPRRAPRRPPPGPGPAGHPSARTALDTLLELARISRQRRAGRPPHPQTPDPHGNPTPARARHEGTDSETATSQEEIPSPSGLVKDDHVHPVAAQNDQFGAG